MFKALLVDDEEAVLTMFSRVLEREGFSVVTANSAVQGEAALARGDTFDIVITDLRMESPLAGFDVVKAANRLVPRPVIVVLTAFPVPTRDWKDAGADALCVKGTNTFALPRQLRALLESRAPS